MAQMITSTKPSIAIIPPNSKEVTKTNQATMLQNLSDLTRSEAGIIIKIDTIVSYLKALEETFSKTRQDLLNKSTFEVRENDKIRAVQGKLISNKAKYHQNLEQDVEKLSQTLNNSFDKINKELKQLQNLSKGSNVTDSNLSHIPNSHTNNGSPIQRSTSNFKVRHIEGPIKYSKSDVIKAINTTKDKPALPFSLKVGSVKVEKAPKKVDFENFQGLANGTLMKARTFNHISSSLPFEKISHSLTSKSPIHSNDASNANDVAIFDSPCNQLEIKSRFYQDEKNKSTSSGSLSDSNEDFSDDDEESNMKSKRLSSCFEDEPTVLSLDDSRVFKF